MKYFLAVLAAALFFTGAEAKQVERVRVSFDVIESQKNVTPQDVLPYISELRKRANADGLKYLAGGDFTLAPYTEENFTLRQEGCDLKLTLSWQPVITNVARKINLKYSAVLYFPLQKYSELRRTIEISSGTALMITESDSENGGNDTRPVRVLLGAGFIEPSYGFPVTGGIGARLQTQSGYPFVAEVLPDSPAKAAGLKFGDEITEVNGYSTLQMSLDKVSNLLRGDPGTKVRIKIYRVEKKSSEEKELVRQLLE